jgi:hypothetical protein
MLYDMTFDNVIYSTQIKIQNEIYTNISFSLYKKLTCCSKLTRIYL